MNLSIKGNRQRNIANCHIIRYELWCGAVTDINDNLYRRVCMYIHIHMYEWTTDELSV